MDEKLLNKMVSNVVNEISRPTKNMTLKAAQLLSSKIRQKAKEMGVNAVVALTNRGGNPVLVEASDDSYIASFDIALNKAYTVVALKMSTKKLGELACPSGPLYGIDHAGNNRLVIFGGGEPLLNDEGVVIGGLGVSGGTLEQDTFLAEYGKKIFERKE